MESRRDISNRSGQEDPFIGGQNGGYLSIFLSTFHVYIDSWGLNNVSRGSFWRLPYPSDVPCTLLSMMVYFASAASAACSDLTLCLVREYGYCLSMSPLGHLVTGVAAPCDACQPHIHQHIQRNQARSNIPRHLPLRSTAQTPTHIPAGLVRRRDIGREPAVAAAQRRRALAHESRREALGEAAAAVVWLAVEADEGAVEACSIRSASLSWLGSGWEKGCGPRKDHAMGVPSCSLIKTLGRPLSVSLHLSSLSADTSCTHYMRRAGMTNGVRGISVLDTASCRSLSPGTSHAMPSSNSPPSASGRSSPRNSHLS
jgi:hypothetical protein